MTELFDSKHAIRIAIKASKISDEILIHAYEHHFLEKGNSKIESTSKKSKIDIVTPVDVESQKAIIQVIHSAFPMHRILAEEDRYNITQKKSSPYEWIIDPLDGTLNFVSGNKKFGNMIALQENGKTIIAVMSLPLSHITMYAVLHEGAFINGEKISLSSDKVLSEAYLFSNIIRSAALYPDNSVHSFFPQCALISDTGCIIDMAHSIVTGDADGGYFRSLPLWDVAAPCLFIEEAGGQSDYILDAEKGDMNAILSGSNDIFKDLKGYMLQKI